MGESEASKITDKSPSVKLVYLVLKRQGPQTQKQLIEKTLLAPRTVRYALTDLCESELVTESIYFPDARQSLYRLSEDVSNDQEGVIENKRSIQTNTESSHD